VSHDAVAAAILTKTIVESSPSLRDALERHAKKNEYGAMRPTWPFYTTRSSEPSPLGSRRTRPATRTFLFEPSVSPGS